jgi:hypothetical protein
MRLPLLFDEMLKSNCQTICIDPHNFTSHCKIPLPTNGRDRQVQMLSHGDSVSGFDEHSPLADVFDGASNEAVAGSIECGPAERPPGVSTLLVWPLGSAAVVR